MRWLSDKSSIFTHVLQLVDLLLFVHLSALSHWLVHAILHPVALSALWLVLFLHIFLSIHQILPPWFGFPALSRPITFWRAGSHVDSSTRISSEGLLQNLTGFARGRAQRKESFESLDLLLFDEGLNFRSLQTDVIIESLEYVALNRRGATASLVSSM